MIRGSFSAFLPQGLLNGGDIQFRKLQATLEGSTIPPHSENETTSYVQLTLTSIMHAFQIIIMGINLKCMVVDAEPAHISYQCGGAGSDVFSSLTVYHVFETHHFIILMVTLTRVLSSLISSWRNKLRKVEQPWALLRFKQWLHDHFEVEPKLAYSQSLCSFHSTNFPLGKFKVPPSEWNDFQSLLKTGNSSWALLTRQAGKRAVGTRGLVMVNVKYINEGRDAKPGFTHHMVLANLWTAVLGLWAKQRVLSLLSLVRGRRGGKKASIETEPAVPH